MKYLTKNYVLEIETDDSLDWENQYKILGEEETDATTICNTVGSSWNGQAAAIEIDEARAILNKLKKVGANHVEIMFHEDHGGYVFNGVELRKSTDEEINAYNLKIQTLETAAKTARIALLEEELNKLKNK